MTNTQEVFTVNELPLIKLCPNFISKDECSDLIKYTTDKLEPGRIVDGSTGESIVDTDYRSANTCSLDKTSELGKKIYAKIEEITNINSSHFEPIAITHYKTGDHFKIHPDYFSVDNKENLKQELQRSGGNRIGTVIVYLNTVEEGGETSFPWLSRLVIPTPGTLVYFKYDHDNSEVNIRTEHEAIKVISGEKYIFTVWIREQPITSTVTDPMSFSKETSIRNNLVDTKFILECGTTNDKQLLSVELPANDSPRNTILVPFTGGIDSSLLLYLLGAANNKQAIPYHIRPICIYIENDNGTFLNLENNENVIEMHSLIQKLIGGNIGRLMCEPGKSIRDGILRYKDPSNKLHTRTHRVHDMLYVYSAENKFPDEDEARWKNVGWSRTRSTVDFWKQPFFDLQKYHIVDALLQLGLETILENTAKCQHNHPTLDHLCEHLLCNERRWAFTKLNKEEFGNKYFINKGIT